MNQEELNKLIEQELVPFMARFEQDNRGNRISLELIQGLGAILHNKIFDVVQKALKMQAIEKDENKKQ